MIWVICLSCKTSLIMLAKQQQITSAMTVLACWHVSIENKALLCLNAALKCCWHDWFLIPCFTVFLLGFNTAEKICFIQNGFQILKFKMDSAITSIFDVWVGWSVILFLVKFGERIWKNSRRFLMIVQVHCMFGCGVKLANTIANCAKFRRWLIQPGRQWLLSWNIKLLHREQNTVWSCDFASGKNTDGHDRQQGHMLFMWQCKLVYSSVFVRARYCTSMSTRLHCMSCTCVLVSFNEVTNGGGFSPSNQPLSPPVFASWSKPLPCHRSFWCSGTIEPVEVLISSSIHLSKGQAGLPSLPSPVGKSREEPWQDPGSSPPAGLSG